jgi:outer membrane protein assembly factor BamB
VAARWPNSCAGSRGLALDAAQHTLFVGCREGKVVALDTRDGHVIASAQVGAGVDIIAWNPLLRHLYAPGAIRADMTVLGYDGHAFATLARVPTAAHAHCVTTDERHQAYVCDPGAGALLVYRDRR